ncbi:hypothetical protein [Paenibacillus jiagnxiensis]|uniref:hypothetical protein n=1 Tax=Paenibacillus jiagnxiensis TaxID=3228926 RepID=UPI0033AA9326
MKVYRKMLYSLSLLTMALLSPAKQVDAATDGSPGSGADAGSLPSGLSGFQSIADDAYDFLMWVIWFGGPIFFLIALFRHIKSNDPGDKKQAKQWMRGIAIGTIGAQIVLWLLHEYLAPKFGG